MLVKAGIATNVGGTTQLFPQGLGLEITPGAGWAYAGGRAFTFDGPQAGSPLLTMSPIIATAPYDIAINVTELTGTGVLNVRVGFGATNALVITEPGLYTLQKYIAGAETGELRIEASTGATITRAVIKSIYIERVT